jgi:hypothetical protein
MVKGAKGVRGGDDGMRRRLASAPGWKPLPTTQIEIKKGEQIRGWIVAPDTATRRSAARVLHDVIEVETPQRARALRRRLQRLDRR